MGCGQFQFGANDHGSIDSDYYCAVSTECAFCDTDYFWNGSNCVRECTFDGEKVCKSSGGTGYGSDNARYCSTANYECYPCATDYSLSGGVCVADISSCSDYGTDYDSCLSTTDSFTCDWIDNSCDSVTTECETHCSPFDEKCINTVTTKACCEIGQASTEWQTYTLY